jgi:hypothetical protein
MILRSITASTAVVILLLSRVPLAAHVPDGQRGGEQKSKPVKVTATIEAIDKTARLITLKGPEGNLTTVYADENVKRFDELRVGDVVSAMYYESVAVHVRRPGDPAPASSGADVTRGKGAMPSATAAVQETVTVTVQAIDRANQAVTVKRKDGGIVSARVENPKYLDMVKVGDTVDITYTRALLMEVTRAK